MSEHIVDVITTEIHGQHLLIRLNGTCLFSLHQPLNDRFQLTLGKKDGTHNLWITRTSSGATRLFTTNSEPMASHIMNATADALNRMAKVGISPEADKRSGKWKWLMPLILLVISFSVWLAHVIPEPQQFAERLPTIIQNKFSSPASVEPLSVDATDAQQLLANRLSSAAKTASYTISLSSGHPRTLFIFADPNCNNCRIFEPTVRAFSAHYNVEIFPVTSTGKTRTAEQVVPILCAPSDQRRELWHNIFDIGSGSLNPTNQSTPQIESCEAGNVALARNDLAFELYRLPGTPTVFADDGRMIPLRVMTSLGMLEMYLNHTPRR
jgi:TrbB protein